MPLLNAGRDAIAQALIADSFSPFSNANAHIAVGNGDDAFDETDTNLQGGSIVRQGMEATYPQRSGNVLTFRSLFGTSDANFAWEEWGVVNHASTGVFLNRKVEALGTKAGTQSWQLTVEVEIVNGDEV